MTLAPTIMVQGTASSVGKSLVATALCRLFRERGLKVAPFKAQNMALNAFVTPDGHEIGRAQAAQAEACGVVPTAAMNPILLKPEGERRSQVIVMGRSIGSMGAADYHEIKPRLRAVILDSLAQLRASHDVVVIEGAGSPAEINLKQNDLVNMFVARSIRSPVLLVGDIDRGGVFAAFVGTLALLEPEERELVAGFLVNKFRGDRSLLDPGLEFLEARTGVPVLGVLPYIRAHQLPEEDSLALDERQQRPSRASADQIVSVAVIRLPRISNYDEFQPLEHEPEVSLRFVEDPAELAGQDLVILPGTKNTLDDLAWLRERGFAAALRQRATRGEPVLGICGGCQMLGFAIDDTVGVEGEGRRGEGLGLLPLKTRFAPDKRTAQTRAVAIAPSWLAGAGQALQGYEIHCGRIAPEEGVPGAGRFGLLRITARHGAPDEGLDGAVSSDGTVVGTMLHGLLESAATRRHLLQQLAARKGRALAEAESEGRRVMEPEAVYARLAATLRDHLDLTALDRIVFGRREARA